MNPCLAERLCSGFSCFRKEDLMKTKMERYFLDRRDFLKQSLLGCAVLTGAMAGFPGRVRGAVPSLELSPLPYPENALEPYISGRTVSFHYGKHHRAYVDNTNNLIKGTDMAGLALEAVVGRAAGVRNTALFNNAAQAWNHAFYWKGMKLKGGGVPIGTLAKSLSEAFGSFDGFKEAFTVAAVGQFGSGWAWLVLEGGSLKITSTSNADTPFVHGQKPLLTIDVWEHAYYLDYQNRRKDYVQAFLEHLVNWDFVSDNLEKS